jgi:sugar O-acyltransferase (sialic acid O-acetyltransferase NeuD family)
MKRKVVIMGYSGHAMVVEDALLSINVEPFGYFDKKEKESVQIKFLGSENDIRNLEWIKLNDFVVAIGDNVLRANIYKKITETIDYIPLSVIHSNSYISRTAIVGNYVQVLTNAVIHPYAKIGRGTICNTGAIVEHECEVGEFCHISVGAVLCGKVKVGSYTFIGANSVVKQGVIIGDNVTVGAGCVVLKDIPDNSKVVGNPMRFI